ncbi:MAG: hypothetical protein JWR12_697 [Mucilaginibacter sp.]|nr:hypothetical protein [Mucilaginibacter sp.]
MICTANLLQAVFVVDIKTPYIRDVTLFVSGHSKDWLLCFSIWNITKTFRCLFKHQL